MQHTYKISFTSAGLSFEIESSDKAWLESKEREYLVRLGQKTEAPGKPTLKPHEQKLPTGSRSLTINEFFKKYVKGHNLPRPDTTVCFVYYLQRLQKKDDIKTADILGCFRDVGYPGYNKLNVADILNKAKRKALLNYVNNLWSLTITGEDFVLNLMSGESK